MTSPEVRRKKAAYMRQWTHRKNFGGNRYLVLERDQFSCIRCGLTDREHRALWGCALTIDHIDGNRANNDLANLQSLCLRCHGSKDGLRADYSKRDLRGEKHGCAKLTNADVVAIRRLREEGRAYRVIAEQFNIHLATVASICTRKTWKHV